MMGMRRNDKQVIVKKERKSSSDSSSSADSGNGKPEEIKEEMRLIDLFICNEEENEEDEDEDQFDKLQGAFEHQEIQRCTYYNG